MAVVRRLIGSLVAVGLLTMAAVVVAAPAVGQDGRDSVSPVIVRITSADTAGTYTVDWQTLGGCDPGSGTSGMSGEVTLTVRARGTADATPEPGELTGTPTAGVVVIRPFCVYVWHVSFVEATTDANCIVGPAPFAPDDRNEIQITLDDPATSCAQGSRIVVRMHPAVPVTVDETDHNAILRTRFIATARRVADAPTRCSTRTGMSKVDNNDTRDDTTDDSVSIELKVVATTAAGEKCRYDVTLRVPRYLAATHGEFEHNVFEDVDPLGTLDFRIGVIAKTIYLVQDVVGDAGGALARYELDTTCGKPDESGIPDLMPGSGGIQSSKTLNHVELREGRFNITAVLADDPLVEDAFDGIGERVLDHEGETCEATITVSELPDNCAVEETTQTVDLTRAPEPAIFEFDITCGATVIGTDAGVGDPASTSPAPTPAVVVLRHEPLSFERALEIAARLAPDIVVPNSCEPPPLGDPTLLPNAAHEYRSGTHQGVDFMCPERGRAAVAALDGRVVVAVGDYENPSPADLDEVLATARRLRATPRDTLVMLYGNYVVVDHGIIDDVGHVVSIYAQLDALDPTIGIGRPVEAGQLLGRVGNSGTDTGALGGSLRLHWELHVDDQYLGAGLSATETRTVYTTLFSEPTE